MTMKMTEDLSDKKWFETWKFFLIKYLLLNHGYYLQTMFMTYGQPTIYTLVDYMSFVEFFLGLLSKCGVTEIKAGIDEENDDGVNLIEKLKNSTDPLIQKAVKMQLTLSDLKSLRASGIPDVKNIARNLGYSIKWTGDNLKKLNCIMAEYIESYIKRELVPQPFLYYYDQFYTYEYQKEQFLHNLPDYLKKYGFQLNLSELEDINILGEEPKQICFLETLLALEYEGFIKILDIESNSHRFYYETEDEKEEQDLVVVITPSSQISQQPKPALKVPIPLPYGWEMVSENRKVHIKKLGQIIYTFPSGTSNQFRYFKCLWNNYGRRVNYQDIFEYETNLKYPGYRQKPWQTNNDLRNSIQKLRKQFALKKVPIKIVTDRGFTLTIDE